MVVSKFLGRLTHHWQYFLQHSKMQKTYTNVMGMDEEEKMNEIAFSQE
jgi:hypothetical protein